MSNTKKVLLSLGAIIVSASGIFAINSSASAAPSTFFSSCRSITIRDNVLSAICRTANGAENRTSLILDGLNNIDGNLVFQRGTVSTFQRSCSNIQIQRDLLSANCRATNGAVRRTTLILNDINNINGILRFN